MSNYNFDNNTLARYCNDARRNILVEPNCKINGIDYIEAYSLNSLIRSYIKEYKDRDKDNVNDSKSFFISDKQIEISEENDQLIIILYCFKHLDHNLGNKNILIEGNNNNNIFVKYTKRVDILKEKLLEKRHTFFSQTPLKDNSFIKPYTKILLNLIDKIETPQNALIIFLNKIKIDFIYTLKIVENIYNDKKSKIPPENFDQVFSQIDFCFQNKEENRLLDCKTHLNNSTTTNTTNNYILSTSDSQNPSIDYMSKDYSSFRRLMLDRITQIAPQWKEQSPADIGIVLVELLAYVGDHLSYFQDAIGTESYLGTARSRISLKRHARLLNYNVNDGCNARVWVCLEVNPPPGSNNENEKEKGILILKKTQLITLAESYDNENELLITTDKDFKNAINNGAEVFETIHDKLLFYQHNTINFYTWGNTNYCIYKGATRASLLDENHNLKINIGDVLILEETVSPITLSKEDADPSHRHAVRVTNVEYLDDYLYDPPIHILNISWNEEDALPFSLWSSVSNNSNNGINRYTEDNTDGKTIPIEYKNNKDSIVICSVAHGNVILADHGYTVFEIIGQTPPQGKFYPKLSLKPLTYTNLDYDYNDNVQSLSAINSINYSHQSIKPVIYLLEITILKNSKNIGDTSSLESILKKNNNYYLTYDLFKKAIDDNLKGIRLRTKKWQVNNDIFNLNEFENGFVTEIESDGAAYIRFGDGFNGQAPLNSTDNESHIFCAVYRVGNGIKGNVNSESISRIRIDDNLELKYNISNVRNPLKAQNAVDFESSNKIRQYASVSTTKYNKAAVNEDDYIQMLENHPEIKSATAYIEWTGTWPIVSIVIERYKRKSMDEKFKQKIISFIESYRSSGYDIKITGSKYVPLDIKLKITIDNNYFQNEIRQRLVQAFGNTSNYNLNSQTKGFFHPDNLHPGQQILYARVHETAMSVVGVKHVSFTRFQRLGLSALQSDSEKAPAIYMAKDEIPIVDNDSAFPSNGLVEFNIVGGL